MTIEQLHRSSSSQLLILRVSLGETFQLSDRSDGRSSNIRRRLIERFERALPYITFIY
ncbi:hypothetical protein DPMN_156582 [Dreissena polymorpha]|uniref:Uncharacterized protein n=1 Tax=Dreissena polymorpha TaxID=45954 RepID=A0A9D4FTT7_DREPO|nr:hypothetical protein DPMN_156582 [Dreissena polymorpha]